MPLSALFILFDLVIQNPQHPDNNINIKLLDIVAWHFALLDYRSAGMLPGTHPSEFVHIAREYVQGVHRHQQDMQQRSSPSSSSH